MNVAAFQGMREVVGELSLAGAIPLKGIADILVMSGGFSSAVSTRAPVVRLKGLAAPAFPHFGGLNEAGWLQAVEDDTKPPHAEGMIVLAAVALHERRQNSELLTVEQYFGPNIQSDPSTLFDQLRELAGAFISDRVIVGSRDPSPGAVVHPAPTIAASVDVYSLMLCPNVASRLGWRSDPNDAFTYRDNRDKIVARTMYWRDGGVQSRHYDTAAHRHGCAILIPDELVSLIEPYMAEEYVSCAWRKIETNSSRGNASSSASRIETPPHKRVTKGVQSGGANLPSGNFG
jgi:hypothetical protein